MTVTITDAEARQTEAQAKMSAERDDWRIYKRRLFLAVGLVAALVVFANFVSATFQILLLLFLCILIAIGIRGLTRLLADHTPLPETAALILVLVAMTALIAAFFIFLGPALAEQFAQLGSAIPSALSQLQDRLASTGWGQTIADEIPSLQQLGERLITDGDFVARITGVFSSILSGLSTVILVIFITLFFSFNPKVYVSNFMHLVPVEGRERMRATLDQTHDTLEQWLLMRLASMALVGVLTFIGLTIIGMPLALPLAVIAAVGAFIPTLGPIIALVPAALVALTISPQQTLFVVLLYLGVQSIDNYLVSPLLQKEMLYLPPAYIIVAQVLFGAVAGTVGLILAAPLAAALVMVVRKLYVEGVLHDFSVEKGEG
jgi:predicted PurR-regulated permease PerM